MKQLVAAMSPVVMKVALVAAFVIPAVVSGQVRFEVPLKVSDGVDSTTLYFGILSGGNFCIVEADSLNGHAEVFLPPVPPGGVFDTRFVWPRAGSNLPCFDQGSPCDFRPFTAATQKDTIRFKSQLGTGTVMLVSWPAGLSSRFTQLTLRYFDQNLGQNVNVDMLTATSADVSAAGDPATVTIYSGGLTPPPAAPALVSPPNGGIVPSSLTLVWGAVSGATVYHVQVATDSLFTGGLVANDTVTATSRALSGLSVPVTYYWRVSAGNALGFGNYSSPWHFTTGTTPAVPTLVAPPNGATGQPTTITLRWNVSSSAQTYHVQLSADSTFATVLVNDSTLTDTSRVVSSLAYGTTYYWHVRAKNGVGASQYSTRFRFTTQFQPPPAPTLLSPPNGQTNAPVTIVLRWNPVSGALSYRLQVATTSTFTTGTIVWDDSTLTATADTVGPLQNSTQYFWRVNARNAAGPGPYSTVWSFTTIVAPPPAPVLQSPPDGAVNVSLVPVLTWNAAPTATSYRLQVSRDSLFGTLDVDDSTIVGTSRQIGQLLSSTTYYWRVGARNIGGIGPYSSRFRFTTTLAPPAPQLILPVDSALHLPATPTFVWTRVAAATAYQLQIATDPTFGTLVLNDSTITDTAHTVSPLPYGARLLWRVRARNSSGSSDPTPPRVFTVMLEPPGRPSLVSPVDNLIDAPVTITLRWRRVTLASGYQVPIAFDTLMTNIFQDTTVVDTFVTVNVLPSTADYWRVRAFNIEHTYGPWTSVRRFTTGNFPPAIPTLLYPAHGDTGVSRNPTFRWTSTPGTLMYRLQVSNNIGFPSYSILYDDSTLTSTSVNAGILPARQSIFWRVRARGTAGWSGTSLVFAFTTGAVTEVAEGTQEEIPVGFALLQNYPNPFNPSTTIPFKLAGPATVSLKVYDMLGREIRTLVDQDMPAGTYSVRWNGQADDNQTAPSGVYLVRMRAVAGQTSVVSVKKMLLLK